ncbi:MAG: hypothetical protein E7311_01535 [Clostridiales bacterium]|nr:hypothetical protein [Clostridiales bacterium]
MTILRLEYLSRQGEPDEGNCSIIVDKEKYDELPILPKKNFDGYITEKGFFNEVYRGSSNNPNAQHKAIILYNPNNKEEVDEEDKDLVNKQTYWYFVYLEKEEVWIVFQYRDLITVSESFGSTVATSYPWHGTIYRPNEMVEKIIRKMKMF